MLRQYSVRHVVPFVALLLVAALLGAESAEPASSDIQGVWPPYVRGKDQYIWALSSEEREDGITYKGNLARLRRVLNELQSGKPIKMAVLGGSVSVGLNYHDWSNRVTYHTFLTDYLRDQHGEKLVTTHNGAVAAVRSTYMSVCYKHHVPEDTDIVLVEMAVNDGPYKDLSDDIKRAEEKLVRSLLTLPKRPAVVFVHPISWWAKGTEVWPLSAEPVLQELAIYYHLPSVSIRGCCFHKLVESKLAGFDSRPLCPAATNEQKKEWCTDERYKRVNISFFADNMHLHANTGHRVVAEMLMHLFNDVLTGLKSKPLSANDNTTVAAPLPTPMFKDNFESKHDRCLIGDSLLSVVDKEHTSGFEWLNDGTKGRVKYGMIATKPGSYLQLKFDSVAPGSPVSDSVALLIAHLRSYEHMGEASVECVSGCQCKPDVLQGHHTERNSQAHLHGMLISQHKECIVKIAALNTTKSGEHKVKVIGVMISESSSGSGNMQEHGFWGFRSYEHAEQPTSRTKAASKTKAAGRSW